jgi:two-component system response regulator MprA
VLTASEALIVDLLLRHPGLVVPANALSRALWGDAILDGHGRAAIRSHIYTLRRKLRAVGLPSALVSAPGWGYRLDAATTARTDVRGNT